MRARMAAALGLVLFAAVASWLVNTSFGADVARKAMVADALEGTQVGVNDLRSELLRLTLAEDIHKARITRSEMRRAQRLLAQGREKLAEAVAAGAIDAATLSIVQDALLAPLDRLDALAALTDGLIAEGSLFGDRAARPAMAGFEATNHLLPLLKRMNDTERAAQREAASALSAASAAALALSLAVVAAIAVLIFRPLARRVLSAQSALDERRKAAERASDAKTQFLATMSHEIRTPMNGVIGMADVLKTTDLTPEQRKMLDVVIGSGAALVQLIDAVLDLSKIEAGRFELVAAPFDLRRLCEEVALLFSGAAAAKGVALRCEIDAAVAGAYRGDAGALRQALSNLVGNAVKFTQRGAVRLIVGATPGGVALTVRDTGVGVPPEAQARIFERFEQADATTTRRFGGTGLGLAIVKRLAEAMGGGVTLESAPGEGSAFTMTLPLEALAPEPAAPTPATPRPALGQARRVLLAEDNEVNRFIFCAMLRAIGCAVTVAENGREAVAAFAAARPDIVLMDVSMPEMDGYEATRAIREIERRAGVAPTPILGLSAHAMSEHRDRAAAADMTDFLTKPIAAEALYGALARHGPPVADPAPATPQTESAR